MVDNGPSEQPSCPLVQMCLVRLLLLLNLDKITQCSIAEYHSKRNYVERVHAEENRVLSQHGPFKSNKVYPSARLGTEHHRANIEAMELECLMGATLILVEEVFSVTGGSNKVSTFLMMSRHYIHFRRVEARVF